MNANLAVLIKTKQLKVMSLISPVGAGKLHYLISILQEIFNNKTNELDYLTELMNEYPKILFVSNQRVLLEQMESHIKKGKFKKTVFERYFQFQHYQTLDSLMEEFSSGRWDLVFFDESCEQHFKQSQKNHWIKQITQLSRRYNRMVIFESTLPRQALSYNSSVVIEYKDGKFQMSKCLIDQSLI